MEGIFDLDERTLKFGKEIILLVKKIPKNISTENIVKQLLKSGTSIGANYSEANSAESRNDFIHKIGIVKKESKETVYWLELLKVTVPEISEEIEGVKKEAKELFYIFNSIHNKTRNNDNP
ncbi:MAG: four helix bundle protein [Candidatus Uhrbacteria bacterium]